MNNNNDIVTNMVNEMGLTPARVDFMQGQQSNSNPPLDSQLQMMDNFASQEPQQQQQQQQHIPQEYQQQQPQQQQQMPYDDIEDDGISNQSYDQMSPPDAEKPPMSWLDTLLMYLKTPSIVAFIFLIFSLPYTGQLITQILPLFISNNGTYLLLLKSLLVAVSFSLVHLLIE